MPFNSFNFWLVFPFIFGLYWFIPAKHNQARKVFLVLVSYLLYMNWKPAFAITSRQFARTWRLSIKPKSN